MTLCNHRRYAAAAAMLLHNRGGSCRSGLHSGADEAEPAAPPQHEIESGRTSSLSAHIAGYDVAGRVLNYSGVAALTPAEIATHARKVQADPLPDTLCASGQQAGARPAVARAQLCPVASRTVRQHVPSP